MTYIKAPAAHEKLERAVREFRPVIILATAGWGKTAAVQYHYRNKATLYLSGLSGKLDHMPAPDSIRQGVVVIDDISWLEDPVSEKYILSLLQNGGRQIVLIGRGRFPAWMEQVAFDLNFVRILERDLALAEKQITKLFQNAGVTLASEDCRKIYQITRGYPPAVKLCLRHVEQGQPVDRTLFAEVRVEVFHFYEKAFFDLWKKPAQDLLLAVCRYATFSPEMAEFLTGFRNIPELLEYCKNVGSFLERKNPTTYELHDELRSFLCWKQEILWSKAQMAENHRKAAYFFETKDQMPEALYHYKEAGATEQIKQVLIRNAQRHPGIGQYYELRTYYEALPRASILESPVLMAGMSMLYSLTLRRAESELWYRELEAYEKQSRHPRELRQEAKMRLAYLDIALPHRAGKGMIGIMRRIYAMQQSGNTSLPEFAVTGNYPSLMNGSLDFCDWAKNGTQIAKFMQKPVEALLGRSAKGLVNIALAESGFERSTMTPYEVVTRLGNGYAAADHGGKIEMCFAAEGVLVRQHLVEGQLPTAVKRLETFLEKAEGENAKHILPNLEALRVWLSLYTGDPAMAKNYLNHVPDARSDFYISNRFRYVIRLRCLIAQERFTEAMDLASYLTHYYEEYERTYLWIENEILKAIILHRLNGPEWEGVLKKALKRAASYHLTRVFSIEGGAILPLLMECSVPDASKSFLDELIEESRRMALFYPGYMKYVPQMTVDLTAREEQILGLLCAGKSTEEICETCGITYSGLKKHNRSIYAKLGVKNRVEAERMAVQLGLVHRKAGQA